MYKNEYYAELCQLILKNRKQANFAIMFTELSPGDFLIIDAALRWEEENNGKHITVNEIASAMNASVPAVSRSLKILDERGYISRITDTNCRRNTFVIVTDTGKNLFWDNMEVLNKFFERVLKDFTNEEIDQMMKFHEKINSILQEEIKDFIK